MMKPHPSNVELCCGRYAAIRHEDAIYLFAIGLHETLGYRTFLEVLEPEDADVPEFRLWHRWPDHEVELPAASPFCERTKLTVREPIEEVVVHDGYGRHAVRVDELPDWAPLT